MPIRKMALIVGGLYTEISQVLRNCQAQNQVVLVQDDGRLQGQGAVYNDMFWPYRDSQILIPHPHGDSHSVLEIRITDPDAFLGALCRTAHFAEKSADKVKSAVYDSLKRSLGFK